MTYSKRLPSAVVLFARILLLAETGLPHLRGQDFDKGFEQTAQLIVMLDVDYGDTPEFGAGIVFGRDRNRILIATAYHVVHRGPTQPARIRVRFRTMRETPVDATVLRHGTPDEMDLAVLSVDMPASRGFNFCAMPFARLGNVADVKHRASVSPVGNPNGTPWGVPVEPDKVSAIEGNEIVFQSAVISSGHSGGGLLDENGNLVGMTIADQAPFGRALKIDAVITLLKQWGYPVRISPVLENGWTPFHVAAAQGDLATLSSLLDCGGVNKPDDHGATALHHAAAFSGKPEVLSLLLKAGANIEARDADGDTPLSYTAEKGKVEAARFLLNAGARPDSRNNRKETVLHVATVHAQYEIVKVLLSARADVNALNHSNESPLDILGEPVPVGQVDLNGPNSLETVKLLIAAGGKLQAASLSYRVQSSETADELEKLEAFLPGVIDLNARVSGGQNLLHNAAEFRNAATARLLVAAGADVNAIAHGEFDRTPLFVSLQYGNRDVAEFLLAHGAKVRVPGTPELRLEELLQRAVEADWRTAVEILLTAGTNPNVPEYLEYSNGSDSLLKIAQNKSGPDIVKLLVDAGAK